MNSHDAVVLAFGKFNGPRLVSSVPQIWRVATDCHGAVTPSDLVLLAAMLLPLRFALFKARTRWAFPRARQGDSR